MLLIDGAYGEGGGQLLRTSLALAVILNRPIRIKNIRAGRKNPGLAAQHLTSVYAAAAICQARLSGDHLGSTQLTFAPQTPPGPGSYNFDVAEVREGGSAGAATLVLQTILLPLALAAGPSTVMVKGGTHVAWSPPFHYLRDIYLPMLARLGFEVTADLLAWGWYPAGEGEIKMEIPGHARIDTGTGDSQWLERGPIKQITGLAVASSLPAHIAQRMADRATTLLETAGLPISIQPQRVRSTSPGAGIFLTAEYESSRAGFSAIGRKGKPAEQVAEEAVEALLAFHQSDGFLDAHLADQLILPLALSNRAYTYSTQTLTEHTLTDIWVVEQFMGHIVEVDRKNNLIHFISRPDPDLPA
jgi:RNA 3'-terminal phosphate cyclase (ATP)